MRQSNGYIIVFSLILTVVLGGLLSGVSQVLGPAQKKAQDLDTKKQILGAIPAEKEKLSAMTPEEILSRYSEVISSEVTNYQGEIVTTNEKGEPVVAENVNIEKNYKKTPENRLFPVFKYNGGSEQAFILPTFGAGLWDAIWGYVAITPNMETVIGVSFDHKGETPGLGARITSDDVQARYRGKELYDNQGDLVSVTMVKGENTPESALGPNKVDGMAGATLTANGVNAMLENYLGYYQNYFEKNVRNESMTMNVENNNQ
ncbi:MULTISPECIES: NADH:ubiquinone reductase (Na(+)-transporting) subunit C [Roseivirga]|uniref:Na(+)-translocating NADH-quinone reductase subunit C n=1 Tax=Roseivirga spongicola TaxID=333140 RepID=A0A150X1H8_9BACT|nr:MULTISPECIES: NADH:ubiquinone reductase (Na(+)-transporting) subunit C [Roseivirga]PWL28462.1 MAG: NADH:ubiquinone reductase (Na(+)-transporting) subunit C [Roseivirga sp. XM-24bin3]KYG72581.1 NADH:ubiquinone reductase (Na(+)-transporting) subunit C [Roseivirga spongicola]MBO6496895.1 NADH:ubiquinone reductase (Na(+)-transporting) subunit C [Roseivirga sp.]MBO6659424.1 NADH:ubiquinone reductase (Na(+)-transporting) subunit C [Roseivirga sp.]MBO6763115.1 NADH:ubiquinone reductase (Na(+)-tran